MVLASVLLTAVGCRSHSAPTSASSKAALTPQACLEQLDLNKLDQALQRCDQIVAEHENDPAPLTDRSFLHTLLGQLDQACLDVKQGLRLVERQGSDADPMIKHELTVRQDICKQRLSMAGKG
ncbi:MAG: hypothetical protein ACON4T_05150 [Synechococcus sp.]